MQSVHRPLAVLVTVLAAAACSSSYSKKKPPPPTTYAVGGTVSGLDTGKSVVLQDNGADDLTVSANGPFTFATKLASGAAYGVTVKTQPSGEQCTVANGAATVGSADVSNVSVTCAPTNPGTTYTIRGTITGLTAGALVLNDSYQNEDLSVASGSTTFAFTKTAPIGTAYAVTVKTQPTGLSCSVANGTGTVAAADVTSIAVSCFQTGTTRWAAPTTWGGLWPTSDADMVQHAYADAAGLHADKGPSLSFVGGTAPTPFELTGLPAGSRWGVGPFLTEGQNYQASDATQLNDLTQDFLVCAVVKPGRNRPFDSNESPIIAKGVGDGKNPVFGGGWVLMQMHEAWCLHYEYLDQASGTSHLFMAPVFNFFPGQDFHDVLQDGTYLPPQVQPDPSLVVVCAGRNGDDVVISANGVDDLYQTNVATYALNDPMAQMMERFSAAPYSGPFTPDNATTVPLTIGGYYKTSADLKTLHPESSAPPPPAPTTPTAFSDRGSADAFGLSHTFEGLVYETGIWRVPATTANIRARVDAIIGAFNPADSNAGTVYARNREAAILGGDGKLHMVGRHAPRIDAVKGQVFGLQAWNRVGYWINGADPTSTGGSYQFTLVYAAGENLALWTTSGGATVTFAPGTPASVMPPNDNPNAAAQLVTLPAGAALSLNLDQALPDVSGTPPPSGLKARRPTWDFSGPVQGQLWIRPTASSGTLRVQKTAPQAGQGGACPNLGGVTCEQKDISLTGLPVGQWKRVSLNGAFTADATLSGGVTVNKGTLYLTNPGSSDISFYAWGVQLTQLGPGLGGADPAELMYDWSPSRVHDGQGTTPDADDPLITRDVLQVPVASPPAAGAAYCLGAEVAVPSGLPWDAFQQDRTAVSWVDVPALPTSSLRLFVGGTAGASGGKLCAAIGSNPPVCSASPLAASFADGGKHVLRVCVAADGQLRLSADDGTTLGSGASGAGSPPNLAGGTFLVGNGAASVDVPQTPWHGYVSRVLACDGTADASSCR